MSVAAMEHVLLLCDDIEQTRDFYCRVIGLRVGDRPPLEFPGFWLYAGPTPCLHIAERAAYLTHAKGLGLDVPDGPVGTGPVDHIAFRASDYDEISARLDAHGVPAVRNTIPGGGPRRFFITDPNGVRIEINVPTPTETRH
jgi:catechol 2,3-dioxygenase-like lactoylglutathione lyase family enzyme